MKIHIETLRYVKQNMDLFSDHTQSSLGYGWLRDTLLSLEGYHEPCTCGNPSKEIAVEMEDFENLVGRCSDCGKLIEYKYSEDD